jgi:hypothetical protein
VPPARSESTYEAHLELGILLADRPLCGFVDARLDEWVALAGFHEIRGLEQTTVEDIFSDFQFVDAVDSNSTELEN